MGASRPPELLRANFIDASSTVAFSVNDQSQGLNAERIYDLDPDQSGSGIAGTTTGVLFSITPTRVTADRLIILNALPGLTWTAVYSNDATLNSAFVPAVSFASTTGAANLYAVFATTTVSTLNIRFSGATIGQVISVGEIILTAQELALDPSPSIDAFGPKQSRSGVLHRMPDGGAVSYHSANKYRATLRWDAVSQSFRDSLLSVTSARVPFIFVPNATATSTWDAIAPNVVVTSDFDFRRADDATTTSGYSGGITVEQTSGG